LLAVMLEMLSATTALLVKVKFFALLGVPCGTLPKFAEVGISVAGTTPVPVIDAVCGLFEALSFTISVPVSVPRMLGVNVTLIVQCPCAATLPPQVLVCA
jgi:hypothetical protein